MPMTTGGGSAGSNPFAEVAVHNRGLGDVSGAYFTVSLWHRWTTEPTSDDTDASILSFSFKDVTATDSIANINLDGGGYGWGGRGKSVGIRVNVGAYTPIQNTGTDDIVEDQWYHYAIVGDGSNGTKAYQNGVEMVHHTTSLLGGIGNFNAIYSPDSKYSSQPAEGQIAHCKMWTVALTQSEIASEMATGEPFRLEDAKCWRPELYDTNDSLGVLSDTPAWAAANGTFGGSVPVAWHRQNALYDPSMGDGPAPSSDTRPIFKMVQVNMYN